MQSQNLKQHIIFVLTSFYPLFLIEIKYGDIFQLRSGANVGIFNVF